LAQSQATNKWISSRVAYGDTLRFLNLLSRWIVCLGSKAGILMTSATDEPTNSALQSEETAETALTEARWYAVQVASGCEKRVKTNLEQRIQTFDVAEKIVQVEIPHTPAVKIRKDGSRQHTEEKYFLAMC